MAAANPVLTDAAHRHHAMTVMLNSPGISDETAHRLARLQVLLELKLRSTPAASLSDLLLKARVLSSLITSGSEAEAFLAVPPECPDDVDDIGSLTWSILRDIFALAGADQRTVASC